MTAHRLTRRRWLTSALALSAAGCLPPMGAAPELDPNAHPLEGLTTFDGMPLSAPKLTGSVTLVDFWASWCAPCRQAFRYLDQLYRTYADDGLYVLGVSLDDDPRAGQGFLARHRPRFATAWDAKKAVSNRFGVSSLPTTVLLNQEGTVVHRHQGFDLGSHRVLESHVRRLVDAL